MRSRPNTLRNRCCPRAPARRPSPAPWIDREFDRITRVTIRTFDRGVGRCGPSGGARGVRAERLGVRRKCRRHALLAAETDQPRERFQAEGRLEVRRHRCGRPRQRHADADAGRERRGLRQYAGGTGDRARRRHGEADLVVGSEGRRPAHPRLHLLVRGRRPPHLRRSRPLCLCPQRQNRRADRDVRRERPHRPAPGPGPRSRKAVGQPDHSRHRLQGPAHSRRARERRACRPRTATSARTTSGPASCAGRFTRSRAPASSATIPGPRTHGPTPARRTTGAAWRSMRSAESCSYLPGPPHPISTAPIARATIYSPIA